MVRNVSYYCPRCFYTVGTCSQDKYLLNCPECGILMNLRINSSTINPTIKFLEEEKTMKTNVQRHTDICKELNKLYEKKNHDYGDSFHQTYLEEGMAMPRIRLADKFNRFKTLTLNTKQDVKDESIRDTLIDLANYAIMTVMELDNDKCTKNKEGEKV